jgi:hypothetical protein
MIHNSPISNVDVKTERKIMKYRAKLKKWNLSQAVYRESTALLKEK